MSVILWTILCILGFIFSVISFVVVIGFLVTVAFVLILAVIAVFAFFFEIYEAETYFDRD